MATSYRHHFTARVNLRERAFPTLAESERLHFQDLKQNAPRLGAKPKMPDQLNQLITDTMTQYWNQRALQEDAIAKAKADNDQAMRDSTTAAVKAELGDLFDLLPDLKVTGLREMTFTDLGGAMVWNIFYKPDHGKNGKWSLQGKPARDEYGMVKTWFGNSIISVDVNPGDLRESVLFQVGLARATIAKNEAEFAEKDRVRQLQQAEHDRILAEKRAQEDAEKAERIRVDAEIQALIAARTAEAQANAWLWPVGKTLTFYQVTWNTGFTGSGEYDYQTGFTLTPELDKDGWITVWSQFGYDKYQTIRLDMLAHRPVWMRLTTASIDDLPFALTSTLAVQVDGIDFIWADDRYYYTWKEGDRQTIETDIRVLSAEWVRKAVDAL